MTPSWVHGTGPARGCLYEFSRYAMYGVNDDIVYPAARYLDRLLGKALTHLCMKKCVLLFHLVETLLLKVSICIHMDILKNNPCQYVEWQ